MGQSPRPVSPMSLAEARRMITDPEFAQQFCDKTRMAAWQVVHAHRRGDACIVLIFNSSTPTPGDAA